MNKAELDTPFVLIDLDQTERNIAAMQAMANRAGVKLRPHAKTHKLPQLAHKQVEAGACGITVAKLDEAEVMVAAGIRDITIAYPIVGQTKLQRLIQLARQARVTVVVDSIAVAYGISQAAGSAGIDIDVLCEFDCGFGRIGVQPGQPVLELASYVNSLPSLKLQGLLTFAGHSYEHGGEAELRRIGMEEGLAASTMATLLKQVGLPAGTVSVGSTPTAIYAGNVPGVTEIRPGSYVFGDLMQVRIGSHRLADCALTVKATIVSRPEAGRAVIDAGTKLFTLDGGEKPPDTGHGHVKQYPGIRISWLTEEHGMLELPPEARGLAVGDQLEIIPAHCCGVINMTDEVAVVRGNHVEAIWSVAGRGKVR